MPVNKENKAKKKPKQRNVLYAYETETKIEKKRGGHFYYFCVTRILRSFAMERGLDTRRDQELSRLCRQIAFILKFIERRAFSCENYIMKW